MNPYCKKCFKEIKQQLRQKYNPNNLNPQDWIGKHFILSDVEDLALQMDIEGAEFLHHGDAFVPHSEVENDFYSHAGKSQNFSF